MWQTLLETEQTTVSGSKCFIFSFLSNKFHLEELKCTALEDSFKGSGKPSDISGFYWDVLFLVKHFIVDRSG